MTRNRWLKVLQISLPAACAAALVLAAAVEIWVRVTWRPERGRPGFFLADPVRGIRLAPGYVGWFAGVPVDINHLGLRDPREYSVTKSANTFRILVLGDSVTFGHGSVYEHTYPFLLEQRLTEWHPDVDWQVWNAAVPGYNTSQELAQLLEVGPAFKPDLVIVGFYENDLIDDFDLKPSRLAASAVSGVSSFVRAHVYSLELYRRLYLELGWRLSASDEYHRRLETLAANEALLSNVSDATRLPQQNLTPFERLSDDQLRQLPCERGQTPNPETVRALRRQPGFGAWRRAVEALQTLGRTGVYRVLFFVNIAPVVCPDGDYFYDGGTEALNEFFLEQLSNGTHAVSSYDAFLHVRPSQMPMAAGHSIGNSNVIKAEVLFEYLRDHGLPGALPFGNGNHPTRSSADTSASATNMKISG